MAAIASEDIGQRLEQLVVAMKRLAGCNTIPELGRTLVEELAKILATQGGSLFLTEESGLRRVFSLDPEHVPELLPFPLRERSLFHRAIEERAEICIDDISQEESIEGSGWQGYTSGALFVFPLVRNPDTVIGVVSVHRKANPLVTGDDRRLGLILASVCVEIIEQIRMSDSLRHSEQRLAKLLSNLPGMAFRCDNSPRRKMEFVSQGSLPITGYAPEEFLGADPKVFYGDLIEAEERDLVDSGLRQALENHQAYAMTYRIRTRPGDWRWVHEQGVCLGGGPGEPPRAEGFISDVTERVKAEQELSMLYMAAEQSADSILVCDIYGTIQYVNKSFEHMTGYNRGKAVGQSPSILKSDRHDAAFYHELWSTIQSGESWKGRITNRRRDGTTYEQDTTISPVKDRSGRITSYASSARDVTKLLKMEQQMLQLQKMEAVGELAAGIAHEINTPTQYIGDNLRFLEETVGELGAFLKQCGQLTDTLSQGPLPDGMLEEVVQLRKNIDIDYLMEEIPTAIKQSLEGNAHVAEIVRAMKEFAHPGTEEMTPVDLNHAIQTTIAVARNEWKYVADMKTELDDALPAVICLPGSINQVLLNIVVNAAHAIGDVVANRPGEKGTITMSTRTEDKWAEIRIADTGTGIPDKLRNRVFDPFFTTKGVGKGTGQGLAIAHDIVVTKHGGQLDIETTPGAGTTFIIKLPLEKDLGEA